MLIMTQAHVRLKDFNMLKVIFDLEHDWYRINIKGEDLSIRELLSFQIKYFVNVITLSFLFSAPIMLMIVLSYYFGF